MRPEDKFLVFCAGGERRVRWRLHSGDVVRRPAMAGVPSRRHGWGLWFWFWFWFWVWWWWQNQNEPVVVLASGCMVLVLGSGVLGWFWVAVLGFWSGSGVRFWF